MNENSHPYDPYGEQPAQQDAAPQQDQWSSQEPPAAAPEPPVAAAEPAEAAQPHPHDPYAYQSGQSAPSVHSAPSAAGPGDPYGNQQGAAYGAQQPYGDAGQQYAGAGAAGAGGAGAAYGAQPGAKSFDVPPPGIKGVYEGPLPGQPTSESDSKLWSMLSHLAVLLGHVLSWGFLGWVGPLVVYLMYKDRNRFIRYNAAEALNGAIAVVITQVVLGIVLGIFGVITLGFGFAAFPLVGIPALIQVIFAIIGAVKANQGEWWNYPLNIRLVK